MGKLDAAFIQDMEHRPNLGSFEDVEYDELPIIDLSSDDDLVSQVGQACMEWGFFQVVKHGVPLELLSKVEEAGKRFFELEEEEKKKVKVKPNECKYMGYHDVEFTKDIRDWKQVFDIMVEDRTVIPASHEPDDQDSCTLINQWPLHPPQFREMCQEYAREVEKLAHKLLSLIAQSLGLPGNRLIECFKGQTSMIRFNRYPTCPFPDLALGISRHKDAGALTILAQDDVGGLQVRRKSDHKWIPVKPTPNAFVIYLGDVIQVWSNDKYESAEHRVVVNSVKERFSIPLLLFPGCDVMIKPLEEIIDEADSPRYKEYNWGKFFSYKLRKKCK